MKCIIRRASDRKGSCRPHPEAVLDASLSAELIKARGWDDGTVIWTMEIVTIEDVLKVSLANESGEGVIVEECHTNLSGYPVITIYDGYME